MTNKFPNHFSYNFEFDLNKVPARKTDRISLKLLLPGMFFGALLMMLGAYELLNGFASSSSVFDGAVRSEYDSIMTPMFFDLSIIAIGAGIITSLIFSYIRYKKVFFDGTSFYITYRPTFGDKKTFKEDLIDYEGVRFRIEFFQYGFINKNKYIVELYNKDKNKIIPLYISTKSKNINAIIEKYARVLNKPIILITDEGVVCKSISEFLKRLVDNREKIEAELNDYEDYAPKMLIPVRRKDKLIVKVKKVIFDAYNLIAFFAVFVLSFVLFLLVTTTIEPNIFTIIAYVFAIMGVLLSLYSLFRRDKIIVKSDKLIVHHKFLGFSKKYSEIKKTDIRSIEVTQNPATGRSFLMISSRDKGMIFGKKVPIDDLRWVRSLLIREVLK